MSHSSLLGTLRRIPSHQSPRYTALASSSWILLLSLITAALSAPFRPNHYTRSAYHVPALPRMNRSVLPSTGGRDPEEAGLQVEEATSVCPCSILEVGSERRWVQLRRW